MKLSSTIFTLAIAMSMAILPFSSKADEVDDSLGYWGKVFDMHVIPIHAMLLMDGQVLVYGTNTNGNQGSKTHYELWDTRSGQHELATHDTGPHPTAD